MTWVSEQTKKEILELAKGSDLYNNNGHLLRMMANYTMLMLLKELLILLFNTIFNWRKTKMKKTIGTLVLLCTPPFGWIILAIIWLTNKK